MIISGLWTHFGYADEFDVPEYGIEREAWLNVLNTLLEEGYTFEMIRKIVRVTIEKVNKFFPIILMHVWVLRFTGLDLIEVRYKSYSTVFNS